MENDTYVETNSEWKRGAALDYYNQEISIVAANTGSDGKMYMVWVYPQTKERKASEKTIPLKITLGDTGAAINILEGWIKTLRGEKSDEPTVKPAELLHEYENKNPTTEGDDVPF